MSSDSPAPPSTPAETPVTAPTPAIQQGAEKPGNFAFVMNVRQIIGRDQFEVAPGHVLRRATDAEIRVIRGAVQSNGGPAVVSTGTFWETKSNGTHRPIPQNEWRYFVIAFTGNNSEIHVLTMIFDMLPAELEVGVTCTAHGGLSAVISTPDRLFHVLQYPSLFESFFVDVSVEDLERARAIYDQLKAHDHSLIDVNRLAVQLGHLKSLPAASPLRFLGYFAILESVLTHDPRPNDTIDSITRQVVTKVALLDNRWTPRIDYAPFGGASAEKVWKKMYGYRSCVAHGSTPDFAKELKILGSAEQALQLIKQTVKAVIRQALKEPQLIRDLQDC